jgi:hypothetical protein
MRDGSISPFDDGISPFLDLGVANAFTADVAFAVPGQCLHVQSAHFISTRFLRTKLAMIWHSVSTWLS